LQAFYIIRSLENMKTYKYQKWETTYSKGNFEVKSEKNYHKEVISQNFGNSFIVFQVVLILKILDMIFFPVYILWKNLNIDFLLK